MFVPNDAIDSAVEALLKSVSVSEQITNPKYQVDTGAIKGDNYLGVINTVKIQGDNRSLSVIVKTAHKNEQFREMAFVKFVYFHEIYFYNTIYPAFYSFQKSKSVERPFESIPKCYATSMENLSEGLVLENLKERGYQLWDRKKPMNGEHIEFVLKAYGRFHALSFALREHDGEQFDEIVGKLGDIHEKYAANKENQTVYYKQLAKSRECLCPVADKTALERFDRFMERVHEYHSTIFSRKMDRFGVIIHGDSWCNNMLFKYEDPTNPVRPISMRLLDFQLVRYGSPVLDLSHIFYTVASQELLEQYRYYMDIYYDSLSDHLVQLGSSSQKVYPHAVFDEHLKKYSANGLMISLLMIKLMISESDEVPDLSKGSNKNIMEAFSYEPKNSDYKKRIRDNIVHFVENGLI